MGCAYIFVCKTCRRSIHIGYGSYQSWVLSEDLELIRMALEKYPEMQSTYNRRYLELAIEHQGHKWFKYDPDWCFFKGDDLWLEGAGWVPPKLLHRDVNFEIEEESEG